jgi:hypothetical protein
MDDDLPYVFARAGGDDDEQPWSAVHTLILGLQRRNRDLETRVVQAEQRLAVLERVSASASRPKIWMPGQP